MSEVEDMNMVEEQDHPMKHWLGEEGMNMVGSHKVEVDSIDMVEEYFHLMNHRPQMKGMDTVYSGMGRIERLSWRWLKESSRARCWRGTRLAMERRGIDELIRSGRSL
jgi:hypothetical protein